MGRSDSSESFGDNDKTIVRPSPGGRQRQPTVASMSPVNFADRSELETGIDFSAGSNPLVANAFFLLSVVTKLRNLPFHHAADELHEQLIGGIRRFESRCLHQGCPQEQVEIATYFLCSLIDETVLNTPWGNQSNWGHHSLLIEFHNEAWGGERFFEKLERLKQNPAQSLNLLELAYLCLSLGFKGRYRVAGSGVRDIEELRQELFLVMQRLKGDTEQALSPHWQGHRDLHSPFARHVPLWVVTAVAGAIVVMTYMGFAYYINRSSDRVYAQLADLTRDEIKPPPARPQQPVVPTAIPIRTNRFKQLLASEIARQMVEVPEPNLLRISNAFASGSDRIKKDFVPMLAKIAREIQSDTRRILVVGHTDNRPIFSARFPSNWHLSQARAKNVADILASAAPLQDRIRFEGHADTEPIVPNDTPKNRARNRRIEIRIR